MTISNHPQHSPFWIWHAMGAAVFFVFLSFIVVGRIAGSPPVMFWVGAMCLATLLLFAGFLIANAKQYIAPSTAQVIGWALALRLLGLFSVAQFEDDFYRYLWDGYQTAIGANPYLFPPSKFFSADALILNDAVAPHGVAHALSALNNPDIPTIYGPALQWLFAIAAGVAPGELWPIRAMWLGMDMWLLVVLVAICGAKRAMLYALCPLVLNEVSVAAHPDGLIGALLFFACLALRREQFWRCGFFLGCAAAMKINALLALPFLLIACGSARPALQVTATCVLSYAAFWLPFVLPPIGSHEAFIQAWRSFATFAREWQFNALGFGLLRLVFESGAARVVALALMATTWLGIVIWQARKSRGVMQTDTLNAALLGAFGVLLLMSPVINTWYLLWLLPLATTSRFVTPWVAAFVLPLSYLTHANLGTAALSGDAISAFALPIAIPLIEGIAIGLALCWDCFITHKLIALTSRHSSASHSLKS